MLRFNMWLSTELCVCLCVYVCVTGTAITGIWTWICPAQSRDADLWVSPKPDLCGERALTPDSLPLSLTPSRPLSLSPSLPHSLTYGYSSSDRWLRCSWFILRSQGAGSRREKVGESRMLPQCLMTHPLFLPLKWFLITPPPPRPAQRFPILTK